MGRRASARRRGPLRLAHPAEGVALAVAGVLVAATLVAALDGSHPTSRANVSASSPQASAGAMPSDASSSVQGDRLQALAASLPPLNDPSAAATVGRGVFARPKPSSVSPSTASPSVSTGGASAASTPSSTAPADPDPTPSATPDRSATATPTPTPTATDSSPSLPSPTATPSVTPTDPAPSPTLTPSADAPTSGTTPAALEDPAPSDAASAGTGGGDASLSGAVVVPSNSASSS